MPPDRPRVRAIRQALHRPIEAAGEDEAREGLAFCLEHRLDLPARDPLGLRDGVQAQVRAAEALLDLGLERLDPLIAPLRGRRVCLKVGFAHDEGEELGQVLAHQLRQRGRGGGNQPTQQARGVGGQGLQARMVPLDPPEKAGIEAGEGLRKPGAIERQDVDPLDARRGEHGAPARCHEQRVARAAGERAPALCHLKTSGRRPHQEQALHQGIVAPNSGGPEHGGYAQIGDQADRGPAAERDRIRPLDRPREPAPDGPDRRGDERRALRRLRGRGPGRICPLRHRTPNAAGSCAAVRTHARPSPSARRVIMLEAQDDVESSGCLDFWQRADSRAILSLDEF
uniref:hypothetical protein n=1 Tax=Methylobacterium longum TaxID=767694 RepID=UPI0035713E35